MKKRMITYISNDKEEEKRMTLFTKEILLKRVFENTQQERFYEVCKIKEDIKYLKLQNIKFDKNVKFIIPEDTNLVLDNCLFKGERIDLIGGNVEILSPNPTIDTNRHFAKKLNKLYMRLEKKPNSFLNISGSTKSFYLNAEKNIDQISIKSDEIYLKNINYVKNIQMQGNNITLDGVSIDINSDYVNNSMIPNKLIIQNSSIYYQCQFAQMQLKAKYLWLKNSNIHFNSNYFAKAIIRTDYLNLENSLVDSMDYLDCESKKIIMDQSSKLKAGQSITLQDNAYVPTPREDNLEITQKKIEELERKRQLISILKGIKDSLEQQEPPKIKTKKNRG